MDIELDDDERHELREDDKTRQLVVPVRGPLIDDLTGTADTMASALPPPEVAPFAGGYGPSGRTAGSLARGAAGTAAPSPASGTNRLGRDVPRAAPPAPRGGQQSQSLPSLPSALAAAELASRTTNPSMDEAAARARASVMAAAATAAHAPVGAAPEADFEDDGDDDGGPEPAAAPVAPAARKPAPALPPLPNATAGVTAPERGDSAPTIVVKAIVHEPSPRRLQREATVVVRRAVRKSRRSPVVMAIGVAIGILALALAYAVARRYWEDRASEERIQQRIEAIRRSGAD